MPNLIDKSFFVRNLTIPNLATTTTGGTANIESLDAFITQYEPKCLRDIFGYAFYKLYLAEIIIPTQRMTNLKTGAEYYDEFNVLQKWDGLIQSTEKISLIANYIYFLVQETKAAQSSGVNTNVPKGQAGLVISPRDKMIEAWNFFSKETHNMISFLWNKRVGGTSGDRVYPEFTSSQFCITKDLSRTINWAGF